MSTPADHPQIDAPELLTARQRTRDTLFTALMWGVYLYLWVPLVSLFAWLLGFEFAYDVMVRSGGAGDLGDVIVFYAIVVVIIFLTVTAWSLGNRLRYGKLHRRHEHSPVALASMARYFELEDAAVEQLRQMRSASIEFDADGRPRIRPHVTGAEPSTSGSHPDDTQPVDGFQ